MPHDDAYIVDIVLTARRLQRLMAGVPREELDTNETVQLAVLHLIQTIGEAAANLSAGFRDAHPAIPWRAMVGARNIIVHRYWEVDLTRIWAIVQFHIPDLIVALEPHLPPDDAPATPGPGER